MFPGFEMLVWWATVKTPGQSHRQNNYFFLKTSPVNSLLWVGSGNCLSFTWDRLSVLCQQLSPSTQQEEGYSQEVARWPRGLCVSHQPVKECLPYAVPELPAAQLESTPVASRLGTQGCTGFPAQVQRLPLPLLLMRRRKEGGGSSRPGVWQQL